MGVDLVYVPEEKALFMRFDLFIVGIFLHVEAVQRGVRGEDDLSVLVDREAALVALSAASP